MIAITSKGVIEVLGRILGGDRSDLEDQVVAARPNSSNRPPPEEGSNPNPVQFSDPALDDSPLNPLRVGGQVVIWRKRHTARAAEVNVEIAGGSVDGVGSDVGGEKSDRESVISELRVGGRRRYFGVGIGACRGKGYGY